MTDTQKILKNTIDSEMAYLWSAIEENLPKSQEMEALGKEKIFRAVKAGYLSYRPIFINQVKSVERSNLLLELLQVFNDWDTPITMTAEQVRDILEEYLTKKTNL